MNKEDYLKKNPYQFGSQMFNYFERVVLQMLRENRSELHIKRKLKDKFKVD